MASYQIASMFPYHSFPSWLPFMTLLHDFPSWLSFMASLHGSLPNSLHSSPSWLPTIAPYHSPLPKLPTKRPPCSPPCSPSCFPSCSPLWLSTKKVMQKGNAKAKNRKNLALLTSYSIPWRVGSGTRIEYRPGVDTRPGQNVGTEYSGRVRRLVPSTRVGSEGWYRNPARRSVYILLIIY